MLDLGPYITALAGVAVLCVGTWTFLRPCSILRCLAAVVAVWITGYIYGDLTGDYTHWQFNILTDALAAWIILRHPAGKVQSALGGTFAVQIAMHSAYGARELWSKADPIAYYEMLTIVAYAQLAIMGLWCGGLWGRAAIDWWRHRHRAMDRRKGAQGVGRFG